MLGIFINDWTLEPTLIEVGLETELKNTFTELGDELGQGVKAGAKYIDEFLITPTDDNMKKILGAIADTRWGKGRFASRLVDHIVKKSEKLDTQDQRDAIVPLYIKNAIIYLTDKVNKNYG